MAMSADGDDEQDPHESVQLRAGRASGVVHANEPAGDAPESGRAPITTTIASPRPPTTLVPE